MFRLAAALRTARRAFAAALAAPAARPLPVQPTTAEILAAIAEHDEARTAANEAERRKAAARKVIDTLSDGVYGPWQLTHVASGRTALDTAAVKAFYALHGATAPERPYAPSLKISRREPATV